MTKVSTIFNSNNEDKFEKIKCDRCGKFSYAYYTLSHLTKGLWIKCVNCGNHAASYIEGLNIQWVPSKSFIRKVGNEEAKKIAIELQSKKVISDNKLKLPDIQTSEIISEKTNRTEPLIILYTDAGTKNNGKKGKQETIVVVCNEKGKVIFEQWAGDYSNNEGEILGLIVSMRDFSEKGQLEIFTDSKIACKWVNVGWTKYHEKKLNKGELTGRHKKYITYGHKLKKDTNSKITWIPRDRNLAGHYIENKYLI